MTTRCYLFPVCTVWLVDGGRLGVRVPRSCRNHTRTILLSISFSSGQDLEDCDRLTTFTTMLGDEVNK